MSATTQSRARVLALVTDAWGGTGGIAQYNRDFLEDISARNDVADVVVLPRIIAREVQRLPQNVSHVPVAARSKLRFIRSSLSAAIRGADLVICGHINLLPLAWLVSRMTGSPLVLLTYGVEVWTPRSGAWRALLTRCAAVVSISEFTLGKLTRWASLDGVRTFVVPNAIDLEKYTPGPRNEQLKRRLGIGDGPLLLTLGRMDADEQAKGFDEVLEALPELVHKYPGIQYCAAGEGSDRQRLELKAEALRLDGRVMFPGYVAEEDKNDLYRLAHVYVMPSRLEGFGYVFLEAIACGVPAIGSTADGSREALMNGALGVLVDPADKQQLISAVDQALQAPFVPGRESLEHFSRARFRERGGRVMDYLLGASRR